jgi:DNA polymerase
MKMNSAYSELAGLVASSAQVFKHGYVRPKSEINQPAVAAAVPDVADSRVSERAPAATEAIRQPKPALPSIAPVSGAPTLPSVINIDGMDVGQAIDHLSGLIKTCTSCGLCKTRTKAVPGTGSIHPVALVIGEAPGADEDKLGLPFVGAAGQFLDKWLEAIGLSRYSNIYITNTLKCRPPHNRDPAPEELAACAGYLRAQIAVLKPKAILTLGRHASAWLMGREVVMGEIHGQTFQFEGIPWMPTYHPSAVLRNADLKRPVWEDLKGFKDLYSR